MRTYELRVSAVVLLSGGLDSAVLAYDLKKQGIPTIAMSMRYGQKHTKEIEAAAKIAASLDIEHQIVDISATGIPLFGENALTGHTAIPHDHHEAAVQKATVVPNRNMVMISLAAALAIQRRCTRVYFASHLGDAAIYNDCRSIFLQKLGSAILLADDWEVRLHFPYVGMSKTDIAALGHRLGVPFDDAWTCYEGGSTPCGQCGACRERREAENAVKEIVS